MAKKFDMPIGALVSEDTRRCDGEYYELTCALVTIDGGKIRNGLSDLVNGFRIGNLKITCMGENAKRDRGVYGFHVEYLDTYTIRTRDAVQMAKTLTTIDQRLERMRSVRGDVRSFGEFAGRVLEVLGGDDAKVIKTVQSGTFYGEGEYQFFELGDGVRWIDSLLNAWKNAGSAAA